MRSTVSGAGMPTRRSGLCAPGSGMTLQTEATWVSQQHPTTRKDGADAPSQRPQQGRGRATTHQPCRVS